MDKVKNTVQRMPRRLKLLSALLACVLVCTLVGVGIAAEGTTIDEGNSVTICNGMIQVTSKAAANQGSSSTDWGTWNYYSSSGKITGEIEGYFDDASNSYPAYGTEATLTNATEEAVILSFEWKESYEGASAGKGWVRVGTEQTESGTYSATLQPKESVTIYLTTTAINYSVTQTPTETVELTNFTATPAGEKEVTLKGAENGSYTVSSGSNSVEVKANETKSFSYKTTDGITVTAEAAGGYKFALLRDGDDPLTTKSGEKVYPSGDTLSALFVEGEEKAPFHIDDSDYYYWEDAMRAAMRHNTKTVVMDIDNNGRIYSLPATVKNHGVLDMKYAKGESGAAVYTIPNGVTLVVPYKMDVYTNENYGGKYSTGTMDAMNASGNATDLNGNEKTYNTGKKGDDGQDIYEKRTWRTLNNGNAVNSATGTAYATLTVPQGVTLNISGTLNVNAVQGATQNGDRYNSRIVGDYGKMIVGGTVNVNAGGTLYALGYVVDANHIGGARNGKINVESGGTLVQMMQITDWRGGDYGFHAGTSADKPVMPISTYYLQNNMVHTTYKYGSVMNAQAAITGAGVYAQATVSVISNGSTADRPSIFVMGEGASVVTDYDYENDRLQVTLNGNTAMNCLKLSAGRYAMDTTKKQLAVSDNMQITVTENSAMTINGGLKFLPGSKLTVEKNAAVNIGKDGTVFFYANADYKDEYTLEKNTTARAKLKATEVIKDSAQNALLTGDATLELKGSLTVEGMLALSTNHPGLAPADENAKVTINKIANDKDLYLYEPDYNRSNKGNTYPAENLPKIDGAQFELIKSFQDDGNVYTFIYAIRNTNWTAPKGVMVDSDGSAVTMNGVNPENVYKALKQADGSFVWYNHKVTLNYSESSLKSETIYTNKNETTISAPSGYVITAIDAGKTGIQSENAKTDDTNTLENGWTDVKLTGIQQAEPTLTLTVKQYAHTVTWNAQAGSSKKVNYSYLASGENEATLEFESQVNVNSSAITIKDSTGTDISEAKAAVANTKGKTVVTVSGITQDAIVTVPYSSSYTVTWNVTKDGVKVDAPQTTLNLGENSATYTLDQSNTNDPWQVVTSADVKITGSSTASLATRTDDTSDVVIENIHSDIMVNIAITTFKYKVTTTFSGVDVADGTPKTSFLQEEDHNYTPDCPVTGKYVVSGYRVTGGMIDNAAEKDICAILPGDVRVMLNAKEVTVELTLESYVAVWNWNAVLDGEEGKAPAEFSYTEYLTDKKTGASYDAGEPTGQIEKKETLRSNGEEGWYAHYSDKWDNILYIPYKPVAGQQFILSNKQNESLGFAFAETGLAEVRLENETVPSQDITVNLVSYTYTVTVKDGSNHGLDTQTFYAGADGMDAVTGEPIRYGAFTYHDAGWEKHLFVKTYSIQGARESTPTKFENVGKLLRDGFNSNLPEYAGIVIDSETVKEKGDLTLTLEDVGEFQQAWPVKVTVDGNEVAYPVYVLGVENGVVKTYAPVTDERYEITWANEGGSTYRPTLKIADNAQLYIKSETKWDGETIDMLRKSYIGRSNSDTYSGSSYANVSIQLELATYTSSLAWKIGSGATNYTYINDSGAVYAPDGKLVADSHYNDGIWIYTAEDGAYVSADTVKVGGGCKATFPDNRTVKVSDLQPGSSVTINTATATTGYYMGDMSFEYVRNTAVYTWDGKTAGNGAWKPVDSFVWRPSAGSKSFTDALTGQTYTVANGSILLVNGGSEAKTYTIKLEGAVNGGDVKMLANDRLLGTDAVEFTVDAGATMVVPITLKYAPNDKDKSAPNGIGTIVVK